MIKEKIFEVIKDKAPMTSDKIANLFQISPKERKDFYRLLQKLEKDGLLVFHEQKYFPIDKKRYRVGIVQGNERGFGFLIQENDDIFIAESQMNTAMNGDEVLVKVYENSKGNKIEGKVLKVIKRANSKIVGTFQDKKTFGFVVSDDSKIAFDVFVPKQGFLNAKDGQKVIVKVEKWPEKDKKPEGKIIQVLGYSDEKGVDILSVVATLDIPMEFSKATLQRANEVSNKVTKKDLIGRLDLRDKTTFTIDGADSKDFDDAISIEKLENGNLLLGVHIADVSHYVKEADEIDKEAYKRGNSVYLIDKVIPMLPEKLSNGICSLNEGVDRLCLSVIMEINKSGKVVKNQVANTVINSSRRLVYDNVSDLIEKGEIHESVKGLEDDLLLMNDLALQLKKIRMNRGSIDFDFPETKIEVDENGRPINVEKTERRSANKLIEEFMILANETIAEQYFWMEIPFLYRIHEEPEEERIQSLNKVLRHLGYKLNTQNLTSKAVQDLISEVKGKDEEFFVSSLVLRSLSKARYSDINDIHFGLASKYYSHFTSPIRRYSDLTIHRVIKDVLANNLTKGRINYLEGVLPEIAKQTSRTERIAQDAERKVESMKMAEYMQDKIGEEYDGIISSIMNFGIFVQLKNTIEGLISYNSMSDYYEYDEEQHIAIGRDSKKTYRIGDKVRIKVSNANTIRGTIDFDLVGDIDGQKEE
ncbi:MAG: ribonuclease R [Peptoniphilaceae bacterium]